MNIVGIIPARLGSSRFPGKPLARILGRPMIEHVYRRCAMSSVLRRVVVATCDESIAEATRAFGGEAVMTSPAHERASDRVAEAARAGDADIVVMIQGDEPMVTPAMIDLAVQPLVDDPGVVCANLAAPIRSSVEFEDRNTIKVVMDRRGDALYFSREPVPTQSLRAFAALAVYKQVCVIPFRRDFLETYAGLAPTPLEQAESVDMLRVLEHGYRVRMVPCDWPTRSVDTPEDLALVESLMRGDAMLSRY
jgi:3-deoxy-manno-octulosonate cytidylyltransferase (CMP-KDO synthetase)